MESSLRYIMIILTIVLTGLSAGLFYAWEVSVIPGTRKLDDRIYLQTMQSINRAILNPLFFAIFFGPALFLVISTAMEFRQGLSFAFWFMLISTVLYLLGTFGITAFGNVPLNNTLDVLDFNQLINSELNTFRKSYEQPWNHLHRIRTICSIASFVTFLIATYFNTISTKI
ncbi:MAG: DUF1772 domain-containing protein [Bacteroidota bacterium]